LVRVVINGENWGVYASVQQFNKDFLKEFYGSSKGTRWKVPGRPNADSGLRYTGEDLAAYKQRYEIKSKDEETPWLALKNLCRVLDETPTEQLPEAIEPILDVEGVLWFLANDVAVVNSDGYWTRASDYSIFLDEHGVFHIVPYDMNEAFIAGHGGPPGGGGGRDGGGRGGRDRQGPPGGEANRPRPGRQDGPPIGRDGPPPGERLPGIDGPGIAGPAPGERGPRGPGASGPNLDPLVGLDDPNKPLRSKLLAVPQYRQQYLENLRSIAYYGMEPQAMEKIVTEYKDLMEAEVKRDTKKNSTFEAFQRAVAVYHNEPTGNDPEPLRNADDRSNATERVPQVTSLLEFFAKRRQFLLTHPAIAALPGEPLPPSYRPAASLEATPTPKKPISKSARNTSVVINEFMAANKTKVIGPLGTYEDWIELHNTGDQEIDLTGFYLSDSTKDLKKWPFPAGTRLPPRGYLVLWADEQEPIGAELHLPFKLKASGETLTLFDSHPEGGIVDQIKFSQQTNDVAFGRWNDQLVPLVPTPGEANRDH
jgi:hypothetical protein